VDSGLRRTGADTAAVRAWVVLRPGSLSLRRSSGADLGGFTRASANDGTMEAFEFTEINAHVSGGVSLSGNRWDRPQDTWALAPHQRLSMRARRYFSPAGIAILTVTGGCRTTAREDPETYYATRVGSVVTLTRISILRHPAYTRPRAVSLRVSYTSESEVRNPP